MAYRVTINGFDVSMDTSDELWAVVGTSQRSLPPMPVVTSASRPGNSNGNGVSKPRAVRPVTRSMKGSDLRQQLEALRPWWKHLTARQLEYVEAKVRGETAEEIGKKVGNAAKSIYVALNAARRKLEGYRDDEQGGRPKVRQSADDDEPEPEPEPEDEDEDEEDDQTEPDVEHAPIVDEAPDDAPQVELDTVFFGGGGDLLQGYLRAVRSYPMLSRQEETDIATRFVQTRDPKLARKLVQSNLRYVVKLALAFRGEKTKLLDIIQEGNLGLMHAVQRFDPDRGCKLVTYAAHWIKAYMKLFVMKNKRLVKVGTTQAQRTLFWSLRKTREELAKRFGGREPTYEEIADEFSEKTKCEVTASDVESMTMRMSGDEMTIERRGGGDDESATNSDWLVDDGPGQDELFDRRQAEENLRRQAGALRRSLNPRMQHILDARILTDEPATLQDMADEFGLSRERVRQLENKILGRLKERLENAA